MRRAKLPSKHLVFIKTIVPFKKSLWKRDLFTYVSQTLKVIGKSRCMTKVLTIMDDASEAFKFNWEEFITCDGPLQTLRPVSDSLVFLSGSNLCEVVKHILPVCQKFGTNSGYGSNFQLSVCNCLPHLENFRTCNT